MSLFTDGAWHVFLVFFYSLLTLYGMARDLKSFFSVVSSSACSFLSFPFFFSFSLSFFFLRSLLASRSGSRWASWFATVDHAYFIHCLLRICALEHFPSNCQEVLCHRSALSTHRLTFESTALWSDVLTVLRGSRVVSSLRVEGIKGKSWQECGRFSSLCLPLCLPLCLYLSVCFSLCLSIYLSVSLSLVLVHLPYHTHTHSQFLSFSFTFPPTPFFPSILPILYLSHPPFLLFQIPLLTPYIAEDIRYLFVNSSSRLPSKFGTCEWTLVSFQQSLFKCLCPRRLLERKQEDFFVFRLFFIDICL